MTRSNHLVGRVAVEPSLSRARRSVAVGSSSCGPWRLGRSDLNSAPQAPAVGSRSCGRRVSPLDPDRVVLIDGPIGPPSQPSDFRSNRSLSISRPPSVSHPTVRVWAHYFGSGSAGCCWTRASTLSLSLTVGPSGVLLFFFLLRRCPSLRVRGGADAMSPPNSYVLTCI